MTLRNISLTCTLFAFALTISAQQYPKPNATQQAGIDKDNSRHFGDSPTDPGPLAKDLSPALTPATIDHATRKVADWELARAQSTWDQIWTSGVLYAGFMATSSQLTDPKYSSAMLGMANQFHWQLRGRQPNQDENVAHLPGADDQDLAQTYLELYLLNGKKDPTMIAPLHADFDAVIPQQTLRPNDPRIPWWWCDALFMAPPAWARLYAATGDHKYIDYLNLNWQRTSDLLYDKQDHLYARDATYIGKLGPNGKKIYWSRGEGWVLGGIARTLEYLPKDDSRHSFYEQQMREMAAALAPLQETTGDAAGLWHSSLLDAKDFPLPENSGSALIVFGMAYGVNQGILDRATYMPVITRAWAGLLRHIYADGRLGDIQQTGAEPTPYYPGSSYDYGIGGFLLAAAELKKLAVAKPAATVAPDTVANTDPAVYAKLHLPNPANPKLRSLFLVGDSTVRNGNGDGAHNQMGWGDELAPYFDTSKINVVNRAIGGRSSRTYISEGHWAETLKLVKTGDVILIQFGHNDSGPLDDPDRARGSINGTGTESKEVDNPLRHVHETVYTFGHYLDQYIKDARAHGATPILCSLVPRKIWHDGKTERQTSTYRGWTREIAERDQAGYIDLNEITAEKYDALGEAAVEPLFGDPHTHTTVAGAIMNAESIVAGLKALPNDPVERVFSTRGKAIKPFATK